MEEERIIRMHTAVSMNPVPTSGAAAVAAGSACHLILLLLMIVTVPSSSAMMMIRARRRKQLRASEGRGTLLRLLSQMAVDWQSRSWSRSVARVSSLWTSGSELLTAGAAARGQSGSSDDPLNQDLPSLPASLALIGPSCRLPHASPPSLSSLPPSDLETVSA